MSRILIADTTDGIEHLRRILSPQHELIVATTINQALDVLNEVNLDLIVVGVHFDDSQMFDLIPQIKHYQKNAEKPLICFCTRDTGMTRTLHTTLNYSTRILGAWMYLDQHTYSSHQDPDAELRRLFARCLTHEARKETLAQREKIQLQRQEIQQLREDLEAEIWTGELEDRLGRLRTKLSTVLFELAQALAVSQSQADTIQHSRSLNDYVSAHVTESENKQSSKERQQSVKEHDQLIQEQEITNREQTKERKGVSYLFGFQQQH